MELQSLLDRLLYESEGDALDFKSMQYRFSGAKDEEKSELLKDILAFANSWRRTDAYILIGVKEKKGEQAEVVGVESHLEDANLQEFVNRKTQRPIAFSYKAVLCKGFQVGIIHIPVQRRPFYLKNEFGNLKKNEVYLRRGSSTSTASIDEISTMGHQTDLSVKDVPVLDLMLIHGDHNEHEDKSVDISVFNTQVPGPNDIPGYGFIERSRSSGAPRIYQQDMGKNLEYFRQLAIYIREFSKVAAFSIKAANGGTALANDVRVKISVNKQGGKVLVWRKSDLPDTPRKSSIQEFYRKNPIPSDIYVEENPTHFEITCALGKIQAKDSAMSDGYIYIGASESCEITLHSSIFCDDLPGPVEQELNVSCNVIDRHLSVEEIVNSVGDDS